MASHGWLCALVVVVRLQRREKGAITKETKKGARTMLAAEAATMVGARRRMGAQVVVALGRCTGGSTVAASKEKTKQSHG